MKPILKKNWMNVPQLPGEVADEVALTGEVANNRALPGEVQNPEDDVIDGDFREVGEGEDREDGYGYEEPEEPEE